MLQKETSGIVPPYAVCSARLFKSEEVRRIYAGMVEWQTQWIQNPQSNREGSSPSSGTIYARVVELVDTIDLGSIGNSCAGSSPVTGTSTQSCM